MSTRESNIVKVSLEATHPVRWPFEGNPPWMPCATQGEFGYFAVVFSLEQADEIFCKCPAITLILCVDVPHCAVCASVADAQIFFAEKRDAT